MAKQKKNVEIEEVKKVEEPVVENTQQEDLDVDNLTPEQIEYAKIQFRKNFNELYSKWAEIEEEPADDEYIAMVKKEFDDAVEETKNRTYSLSDEENALKAAELLKEWNRTANKWTKGSWRGVIMFDKVIDKKIEEIKENKSELIVDYSTLVFLYQTMIEPSGVGFDDAMKMAAWENYNPETDSAYEEESPVTYSGILEKIKNYVNELSANDKKLNLLRERWFTANAGLRTKLKVSTLEEFVEYSNAVVATNQNPMQN